MKKLKNSITARLLAYVVLISTALTLVLVCLQIYMDYSKELDRIDHSVAFIQESFGPIVAEALWNFDRETITNTLGGILEVSYVERVSVQETNEPQLVVAGKVQNP